MTSKIQARAMVLLPLMGLALPLSAARAQTAEEPSGFISSKNHCIAGSEALEQ